MALGAWSLLIFATVPIAEYIQKGVEESLGRNAFIAMAIVVTMLVTALVVLRGRTTAQLSAGRAAILLALAGVFVMATVRLSSLPEEATHFVEYGILAGLAYWALAPRTRNRLVYPTALMVCACVGQIDEALQWVMPGRYWELRDVGLNLTASVLVLTAIALGLSPAGTQGDIDARSVRRLLRASMAAALLLAMSMLNTPNRIAWYTSRLPALAFLANADSAMFEYGYYYDDKDTGSFKSRLSPAALAAADRTRGADVGMILDRYDQPEEYADVLRIYSPVTDPFVHEIRVHLFRRDRYYERALGYPAESHDRLRCATIAYSEHKILEKYFGNTLSHSKFVLDPARLYTIEAQLLSGVAADRAIAASESAVSRNLMTGMSEGRIMMIFAVFLLTLLFVDRRLSARLEPRTEASR
jgi:hypothetical protein